MRVTGNQAGTSISEDGKVDRRRLRTRQTSALNAMMPRIPGNMGMPPWEKGKSGIEQIYPEPIRQTLFDYDLEKVFH